MKKFGVVLLAACLAASVVSCASDKQYKRGEQDVKKPVNCATAEGDMRSLQHEKSHTSGQIAAGITSIVPVSLVAGIATGTEGTKLKVASGEYNKMIDKKIAEIKRECGIN